MDTLPTVYRARRIHTMNATLPSATHVAVRAGRVVGIGTLDASSCGCAGTLDTRFADKVLLPGLVEAHCHVTEGTYWRYPYVGYFDRVDPDGRCWPGAVSIADIVDRLRRLPSAADDESPIAAWGLDPIYYGNRRCTRHDLDRVSTTRPIGVLHASGHAMSVNTRTLELASLMRAGIDHPGIPLGDDGLPAGEMRGPEPMALVGTHVGLDRAVLSSDETGLRRFARMCVRKGVTTATDMASLLPPEAVAMMLRVTGEADFPVRVVAMRRMQNISPAAVVAQARALRAGASDRLRLGAVKVVVDGSIQGFSARLSPPGYHNGAENGLWYVEPEALREVLAHALRAGVQVHLHTNGDEATELVLDCMEAALARHPAVDHRFTIQHAQLATRAHFERMKALGMGVNLFANHLYYWGDQHHATTVGPERAERMNACGSACEVGLPFAIHSDAPVTPLGPLFTAWCAVNRRTASGRVLGPRERIGVADALHAITLGAAHTLGLDAEIGSIEVGKRADFAVLEDDPYDIGAEALKDVRVWGVVQDGRVIPAGGDA